MGDFFGGGGEAAPPGHFETPPVPYTPNDENLTSFANGLLQPSLFWGWRPYRTIDYGHGDYNPQTMSMHIPTFNPQAQQNNPWVQPPGMMQFPLGAYSYMPPGANSMFNPAGNYGMTNGFQGVPPFNPALAAQGAQPDFNGPFGPGGQQPQQPQQGGQQPGGQQPSKPDKKAESKSS